MLRYTTRKILSSAPCRSERALLMRPSLRLQLRSWPPLRVELSLLLMRLSLRLQLWPWLPLRVELSLFLLRLSSRLQLWPWLPLSPAP